MTQKHPVWLLKNPLGTIMNLLNHLQHMVGRYLREKQVYRIDHYLGKDTVNNILTSRFSNVLLEPLWNRSYIEEVQIYADETIGCEGRGNTMRPLGAVRDIFSRII